MTAKDPTDVSRPNTPTVELPDREMSSRRKPTSVRKSLKIQPPSTRRNRHLARRVSRQTPTFPARQGAKMGEPIVRGKRRLAEVVVDQSQASAGQCNRAQTPPPPTDLRLLTSSPCLMLPCPKPLMQSVHTCYMPTGALPVAQEHMEKTKYLVCKQPHGCSVSKRIRTV